MEGRGDNLIDIPLCHRKQAVQPKKLNGLRCWLARARTCNNAATRVLARLSKYWSFIRTLKHNNHGTSRYVKSRQGKAANTTSRHGPDHKPYMSRREQQQGSSSASAAQQQRNSRAAAKQQQSSSSRGVRRLRAGAGQQSIRSSRLTFRDRPGVEGGCCKKVQGNQQTAEQQHGREERGGESERT